MHRARSTFRPATVLVGVLLSLAACQGPRVAPARRPRPPRLGAAGLIMWVPSGAIFIAMGLALFAAWLGKSERRVSLGGTDAPPPEEARP